MSAFTLQTMGENCNRNEVEREGGREGGKGR